MVPQSRQPLRGNHETPERNARATQLRGARRKLAVARAELFLARKLQKIQDSQLNLISKMPPLLDRLARLKTSVEELQHLATGGNRERFEICAIQFSELYRDVDGHYRSFLNNNEALLQYTADALNSGGPAEPTRMLRRELLANRTKLIEQFQAAKNVLLETRQRLGITD